MKRTNKIYLVVVKEDSASGIKKFIDIWSGPEKLIPFFIQPYESITNHASLCLFENPIKFDINNYNKNISYFSENEMNELSGWLNSSVLIEGFSLGRDWKKEYSKRAIEIYINMCGFYYDSIIRKYKPDGIIDFESDNLIRAILDIVRKRYSCKYMVFYSSRFSSYNFLCDGIIEPKIFKLDNDLTSKATSLVISEYRRAHNLHVDEKTFDTRNKDFGIFQLLKSITRSIIFHLKIIFKTRKYRKKLDAYENTLSNLMLGGGFYYLVWQIKFFVRRYCFLKFYGSNIKRSTVIQNKYAYFALGQTVEGSEPNFSNGFLNDLICVQLLKPYADRSFFSLLVKDHRSMAGDRRIWQIKLINSLFVDLVWGRQLIEAQWSKDPISIVRLSDCVFTLSGSVGLEALLYKKPSFVFGNPLYKQIFTKAGHKFPTISDLPSFVKDPAFFSCDELVVEDAVKMIISNSTKFSIYQIKRYDAPRVEYNDNNFSNAISHIENVINSNFSLL